MSRHQYQRFTIHNSQFIIILLLLVLAGCDNRAPVTATPTAFTSGPVATLAVTQMPATPTLPPPPTPESIVRGGLLTVRLRADVNNFNPLVNTGAEGAGWVNRLLYSGLTRLDAEGMAQPDLAESWQVSSDGLQLTFNLRKGVLWHDGQVFSSDDVGFTYNVWSKLPATTRLQADLAAAGATFSLPNPLTVVVKLNKPFAPLLADLSAPIVPAHLLKDVSSEQLANAPFSTAPIGTGPFKWSSHDVGKNIVLAANADYYAGKPYLDRVAFLITGSDKVAADALLDGTLLAGQLSYAQYTELQGGGGVTKRLAFGEYPSDSYYFLAFNLHGGRQFGDYRLRRAFAFALDRDKIVGQATSGEGLPIWSTALPSTWAYEPNTPRYAQDQPQSRQLLAEAGWQDTNGDGIADKDGQPLAMNLYVRADDSLRRAAAQEIAVEEASVGISVTVIPANYQASIVARIDPRRSPAFDYDVMLMGWGDLGYDYDPYGLLASTQQPTAEQPTLPNYVGYSNANFDSEALQARGTYDYAVRKQLAAHLQLTLAEELPYYPLWSPRQFVVGSTRVGVADGTRPVWSSANWMWNVEKWYLVGRL